MWDGDFQILIHTDGAVLYWKTPDGKGAELNLHGAIPHAEPPEPDLQRFVNFLRQEHITVESGSGAVM
jgi:hypothetical protein